MASHALKIRRFQLGPRHVVGLLALAMVGLCADLAIGQDLRKWKDNSGMFEIEAKYVSFEKGVVTLEQNDGSSLEIEYDKLSPADRTYVTSQAANPFKKKAAASPFMKKTNAKATDANANAEAGAGRLIRPNWDGVQTLAATPSSTEWKVAVSTPTTKAEPAKLRPVPVPPKADFFESARGVAVNGLGTRAVVGYAGARPGPNQNGASRVVLCDLEMGKMLGAGGQPGLFRPLALSDDGLKVLMRTDKFGGGGGARLEFWNLGKSGISRGDCWEPYEGETGHNDGNRDVRWAAFLDAKRFATVSEAGKLVIWQAEPLKPLATLQLQSGCTPALSPDRKFMAFATPREIGLFDLNAGEVLTLQPAPVPNMAWTSFAFSPSGKRLACQVFVSKLFIYEVADGSQYREVPLMGVNGQSPAVFTDEDHVMIGGQTPAWFCCAESSK